MSQRFFTSNALKLRDIATALALLTRLPVRARFDRTAQAAWAFPVVGLIVGLAVTLVASLASYIGLTTFVSAGLATAAGILITGAMHEDGLADTADGLWGGWDKARRLEIMHDSRIGTYGVLALILAMLLRFSAISSLLHAYSIVGALIAASVLSRAAIPYVMTLLPHARSDGLSVQTGRPSRKIATIGALIACAIAWVCVGFLPMILALAAVTTCTAGAIAIARAKIGGQTGDILGATQIITELAALITFAALI
jgi:adenosylcobinamide-GDP ribazoletransferase